MTEPFVFGTALLDALTAEAQASPRRRRNRNFHATAAHPAQRLLNAVEPGSYVRPHRHREADRAETLAVLRGAFGIVFFGEHGSVSHSAVLRAQGEAIGADIPPGVFHSMVALTPGSVFFESKAGPYDPLTDKDFAPWAPPEGDPAAAAYLAGLQTLFPDYPG